MVSPEVGDVKINMILLLYPPEEISGSSLQRNFNADCCKINTQEV